MYLPEFLAHNRAMKTLLTLALLLLPSVALAASDSSLTYSGTPRVVDGDSIMIGNTEMRLLCIDAVELHQDCTGADGQSYHCGENAKQAMTDAIAGRRVRCHGTAHDKYNRPLVWCKAGKTSLNRAMVDSGWAISTCKSTRDQENAAKAEKRGIWGGTFEIPHDWRKEHPWH